MLRAQQCQGVQQYVWALGWRHACYQHQAYAGGGGRNRLRRPLGSIRHGIQDGAAALAGQGQPACELAFVLAHAHHVLRQRRAQALDTPGQEAAGPRCARFEGKAMHGVHHRHAGEAPGQARHHTSAGTVRVQEVRLALAHQAHHSAHGLQQLPGCQAVAQRCHAVYRQAQGAQAALQRRRGVAATHSNF